MGRLKRRVFLDACVVIYMVEGHREYAAKISEEINQQSQYNLCISPLVKMECLIEPLKHGNKDLINRFQSFFDRCETLSMDEAIFFKAAELRAQFNVKPVDAIHLATMIIHHCEQFWTNDQRLAKLNSSKIKNLFD